MIEVYVLTAFEQVCAIRNKDKAISNYVVSANGVYNAADIMRMKLMLENELSVKGKSKVCLYGFSKEAQEQINEIKNRTKQKLSLTICNRRMNKENVGKEENKINKNMSNAKLYFDKIEELHFVDI